MTKKLNKSMTNFNLIFIFFIQQSITQNPPVVPLTNALTAIYCHDSDEIGIMTIRCGLNEKIRMLDAYDVVVKNKSHLPLQCLTQKYFSLLHNDHTSNVDCKIPTSFTSACSGRENCSLNMQRIYLNTPNQDCRNELVDYTMAFFECISDVFIHDVCSSQAITSDWGTLKTPNFPNPYTSNDDCWCKLSTQLQYRLLLSVIVFQLIPYDQQCARAGLYLQSGDEQRSTQCTYLQQGHNYLSDINSLYINFYSRTSTVRGGFWIIYEGNHPNAEVHLHCGSREKIGVPSMTTSLSSPLFSSSYNHGWTRLIYNNPTTIVNDQMRHMHLFPTTTPPSSFFNKNLKIIYSTTAAAAFTYPYGRLTTFELDYGPKGWFLKYLFGSSNMTATKFLQTTTSQSPVVKWNSTWRYIRRLRPRIFTKITTQTTTTTISTTTTTIPTTTLTSITTVTSTIETTQQYIIPISSTTMSTTTLPSVPTEQHSLLTQELWIDYSTASSSESSTPPPPTTTTESNINSTTHSPTSSFTSKTTLPSPTPWYPPAGPFDWWQWQRYTTKVKNEPLETLNSTQSSTTTTVTTNSTTTRNPTNTTSIITLPRENPTTTDWFKWPHLEFTSTIKSQSDYDEEEYNEWPDYFAATKISPSITTNFLGYIPFEKQRKKLQKMSYLPTKSNEQVDDHLITYITPTSRRHLTLPYTSDISERNDVGSQLNGVTTTNLQNFIEQENKKTSEENGWLSKTDMTIVAVSILFVILLALINLILFAVRRHRHRVQGRHLLSTSSLNIRRIVPNDHLQNTIHTIPINSFINTTNNNNNDILPAVGEIVIWDEKDQGGYTIDNHGEWAKIDGQQWRENNASKNCSKTSFSKSFRSRFQFIRQSNKKGNYPHQQVPRTPQQAFKYPLLMDTSSLSPVPEVDDYRLSEMSSETTFKNSNKTIQALIHRQPQNQNDEYYKRIEINESESDYTIMHENSHDEYSLCDEQTDRSVGNEIDAGGSVIISVPTMLREEDDTTDCGDSIYNQNYSIHSFENNRNLNTRFDNYPKKNNTTIIGHCQTDFQPLDPNLLLKSMDKSLLTDHQQFYSYSQSLQFSAYDSGFFDDQTMDNSSTSTILSDELEDNNQENLRKSNRQKR